MSSNTKHKYAGIVVRGTELLVGLLFLSGAILKAFDINLFIVQVSHYGVIERHDFLQYAALGTLLIETAFGLALVIRLRLRGFLYLGILALLTVFTGLIAYGWAFHGIQDCGCFGPIEMSPSISILKNIFLAALIAFVWRVTSQTGYADWPAKISIPLVSLTAIFSIVTAIYGWHNIESIKQDTDRPFAQFNFSENGQEYNLGQGEYFVAMLSMTCEHCMAAMPTLNTLAERPDMPPLVAICYEESPGTLATFREQTLPTFPLFSINDRIGLFFSLIGNAPPRFYLIRDGQSLKYWDDDIPSTEEIQAARGAQ